VRLPKDSGCRPESEALCPFAENIERKQLSPEHLFQAHVATSISAHHDQQLGVARSVAFLFPKVLKNAALIPNLDWRNYTCPLVADSNSDIAGRNTQSQPAYRPAPRCLILRQK